MLNTDDRTPDGARSSGSFSARPAGNPGRAESYEITSFPQVNASA